VVGVLSQLVVDLAEVGRGDHEDEARTAIDLLGRGSGVHSDRAAGVPGVLTTAMTSVRRVGIGGSVTAMPAMATTVSSVRIAGGPVPARQRPHLAMVVVVHLRHRRDALAQLDDVAGRDEHHRGTRGRVLDGDRGPRDGDRAGGIANSLDGACVDAGVVEAPDGADDAPPQAVSRNEARRARRSFLSLWARRGPRPVITGKRAGAAVRCRSPTPS
jgi:hypothetical protein